MYFKSCMPIFNKKDSHPRIQPELGIFVASASIEIPRFSLSDLQTVASTKRLTAKAQGVVYDVTSRHITKTLTEITTPL